MGKIMQFLTIVIAIMYILWPLDLIPDFIPVIGWIDDIFALVTAISAAVNLVGGVRTVRNNGKRPIRTVKGTVEE